MDAETQAKLMPSCCLSSLVTFPFQVRRQPRLRLKTGESERPVTTSDVTVDGALIIMRLGMNARLNGRQRFEQSAAGVLTKRSQTGVKSENGRLRFVQR